MYLAWRLKIAETRWFFSSAMSLRFTATIFCGPTISGNALKKLADQ
jgi:hypothetical protein